MAKLQQFFPSFPTAPAEEKTPPERATRQARAVADFPAPAGAAAQRAVFRVPPGFKPETVCLTPPRPPVSGEPEERFFAFFREAREAFDGAELILCPPETAPIRTDFSRRGVRGLLRETALFEAFFRAAYRTSALARVSLLLPFVNDPGEAVPISRCAQKALRTLLYRREPFDETIPIGIRLETPAAVLCGQRLLEDWDFAVADTDSLAMFLLALPAGETPGDCGRNILCQAVRQCVETAHVCGRFCGISGFLAAEGSGNFPCPFDADALFLPPKNRLPNRLRTPSPTAANRLTL